MEFKKETVEIETQVVSADGTYARWVKNATEEERKAAIESVRKYEESARGVLFSRLQHKGVIKPLTYCRKPLDEQTEEEKKGNRMLNLLDGVLDAYFSRATYYLFTPASEEDIKDLYVFAKMKYDISVEGEENEATINTYDVKAGGTYIFDLNSECEWCRIINLDKLSERVSAMAKYFGDIAKNKGKSSK